MKVYDVQQPIFKYSIENWGEFKTKILEMIEPYRGKENIDTEVYRKMKLMQHTIPQNDDRIRKSYCGTDFDTDFFSNKKTSNSKINPLPLYAKPLLDDLRKYLNQWKKESTIDAEYHVTDLWFETCMRTQYHGLHDHGGKGVSCVLYVEMPEGAIPTQFRDEWDVDKWYTPDFKEGDLVIFPAWWKHRGGINDSDERRTIIGFNMHRRGLRTSKDATNESEFYYTSMTCHS